MNGGKSSREGMFYNHYRIDYRKEKTYQSLGRNGWIHTNGLDVYSFLGGEERGMVLRLSPVTSKGKVGRCVIEIPLVQAPMLAKKIASLTKEWKEFSK